MIQASELILNADGSIYHLNLLPQHICENIITVGDPDRVEKISNHFDFIEFKTQKREIKTHIGTYNNKRIMVISTGMGSDNIDIVLNELDALANIDFTTRKPKKTPTSLNIIRIGTSGSLQENIPIDSFLVSKKAIGLDGLLHFYNSETCRDLELEKALNTTLNMPKHIAKLYAVDASEKLFNKFKALGFYEGITATAGGFYGPQGRVLRIPLAKETLNHQYQKFSFNNLQITNLEMETAAIYGLSKLLGHQALSINCILANRATGEFSTHSTQKMEKLIQLVLENI